MPFGTLRPHARRALFHNCPPSVAVVFATISLACWAVSRADEVMLEGHRGGRHPSRGLLGAALLLQAGPAETSELGNTVQGLSLRLSLLCCCGSGTLFCFVFLNRCCWLWLLSLSLSLLLSFLSGYVLQSVDVCMVSAMRFALASLCGLQIVDAHTATAHNTYRPVPC